MPTDKNEHDEPLDSDVADDSSQTERVPGDEQLGTFLTAIAASMARSALQVAARTGEAPLRFARSVLTDGDLSRARPDNLDMLYETGQYLK
ncbi:MAG: hypothetical protein KJO55_00515, partial [Gammaproteobacteria bacterium]|nr:hypothetical protein [Gammaproteobacteria bacterium]